MPFLYAVTYVHLWRRYRRADETDRRTIKHYLVSRDSVHRSFMGLLSVTVYLGLFGRVLIPAYFTAISAISNGVAATFQRLTGYTTYWQTISASQVTLPQHLAGLPNPASLGQSINIYQGVLEIYQSASVLPHLQQGLFLIISILSFFMVGFKAAANLMLFRRPGRLNKIFLSAVYTTIATAAVSAVLKYFFFVQMEGWTVYAIMFSLMLNLILTAQTTD